MTNKKETGAAKELREFALVFGVFFGLFFGIVIPIIFSKELQVWPWFVSFVFWIFGTIFPLALGKFYRIWLSFGHIMGRINTFIILGIIFYLVFFPFGLVMRIFGKDLLLLNLDSKAKSYRVTKFSNEDNDLAKPF